MIRKRGLVHFCGTRMRRHAVHQKWTCPLFRAAGPSERKGDRSIFPRRLARVPISYGKNGPVPFSGFTLLEIILALAILAGSLAALGEVMRLADQNAAMTRDETQAQIIAASVMDELVSGARVLTAVNQATCDEGIDSQWVYSVAVEQTGYVELVEVRVLVEQQLEAELQPARFELVRWLPNPDYIPAGTGSEETGSSSSSAGAGSSSSIGGAGGQP